MATPNKKPSRDVTAVYFLAGIPIWIIIALALSCLTRIMQGMTGAQPINLLTMMPSHLIIAYFTLSFIVALTVTDLMIRIFFAVVAHLLLVASIVAVVQPEFSHDEQAGRQADVLRIVICFYAALFLPWIVLWVKFAIKGNSTGSRILR